LFFDACREEPTVFTEAIIGAIMNGLCPHQAEAVVEKTDKGTYGQQGRDWVRVKFWYFREDPRGFGKDCVPEFTRKPAAHLLGWASKGFYSSSGSRRVLSPRLLRVAKAYRRSRREFRQRARKVHKFDHYFDAWRFLFQFI